MANINNLTINTCFFEQAGLRRILFISDASTIKPKNYFAFGTGPRMCIGNNFAMAEMSFFLFTFLKEFQIKPTGKIPEMKPLITLRPDKILLSIERNNI